MPPKKDYMNTGRKVTLPKKAAVKQPPRQKAKATSRPAPTGRTGTFKGITIPRNVVDPVAPALEAEDDGARALRAPLPRERRGAPIAPPPPRRGRVDQTVAVLEARGGAKKRKATFSPIDLRQYVEAHGHDPISNVVLALEEKQRKIDEERARATTVAMAVNNASQVLERQMRRYQDNQDLGVAEINAAFSAIPETLLLTRPSETEIIEEEDITEVDIRGLTDYIAGIFNNLRTLRTNYEEKLAALTQQTTKAAKLEAENQRLSTEFEEVRKARDNLKIKIDEKDPYEDRYNQADARLKELQDEYSKNLEELNKSKTQVKNLSEEVASLKEANERALKDLADKQDAIDTLNLTIADLGNKTNNLNQQHNANGEMITRLQGQIDDLKKAFNEQKEKAEQALNENIRLNTLNTENQRRINEMGTSIQNLRDEKEDLQRSLKTVSDKLKAAEDDRDNAIAQFGFNSNEVRSLRDLVERIKRNVTEANEEANQRITGLNEQIRRTETQRDNLQAQLADAVQENNVLKERLAAFDQLGVNIEGVQDLPARYEELRQAYDELEATNNQNAAALEEVEELIAQNQLLYAEEVRQQLNDQLAALRTQMEQASDTRVRQAVERVSATYAARTQAAEASVADVQAQLNNIREEFLALPTAIQQAVNRAEEQYNRQLEEARNHYEGIIRDLRARLAARPEPVPEVPVRRDAVPDIQDIIRDDPLAGPERVFDHHMDVENDEINRGNNRGEIQARQNQAVARVNAVRQHQANPGVNGRRGRLESYNPEVHRRSFIGGGGAYLVGSAPDINLLPNERIAQFWTNFYRKHLVLNF